MNGLSAHVPACRGTKGTTKSSYTGGSMMARVVRVFSIYSVEGVNAMLNGGFVNVQQKFFRVFRLTKLTFLLAFTIAGYNVECIRSFYARKAVEAEVAEAKRKHRKKRRKGTWSHLLDGAGVNTGPDPPPA